jgi:RNA 2',3'-cyclic 3'-phosphodiesterase
MRYACGSSPSRHEAHDTRAASALSLRAVAKERLGSPRARLFVALDLPDRVRDELTAWQARECTDPALRPLAPDQLHVTLCFLGWQPERKIERIAALMEESGPRAVGLRLAQRPKGLPPGRRPRLFVLEAESRGAVELQAELSDRLEAHGFFKPEKRPFWPHVTVARVRSERVTGQGGRRRKGRPRLVSEPPGALPKPVERPFDAVRLALYRSNLRPQGAEYVSLAYMDLPPTEAGKR